MSEKMQALIDGYGAGRLAERIIAEIGINNSNQITILQCNMCKHESDAGESI